MSKYTEAQINNVQTLLAKGVPYKTIAKKTRVSPFSVNYYAVKLHKKTAKTVKPVTTKNTASRTTALADAYAALMSAATAVKNLM